MKRRNFLISASAFASLAAAGAQAKTDGVTFHFYGAQDCPPCMAFKRNHLEDVRAAGAAVGFAVEENVIPKTRDVPNPGVYGDRDAILRVAAKELDITYPPIFFVSKNGQVTSVHAHDWQAALKATHRLATA